MKTSDLAAVGGGHVELRPSIFCYLEESLKTCPDETAVISLHQSADHLKDLAGETTGSASESKCLHWTFSQLHNAALQFARGLMARGISPGMTIATMLPRRVEFGLTLWMNSLLRMTLCPVDYGILDRIRETQLAGFLTTMTPDVVVVLDGQAARAFDHVFEHGLVQIPPPKVKIVLEDDDIDSSRHWVTLSALVAAAQSTPFDAASLESAARTDDFSRPHLVITTSGTSTGNPKLCPRHVESLCYMFTKSLFGSCMKRSDRFLDDRSNFRTIVPSVTPVAWAKGAAVVMSDPALGARGALTAIREHRVTFLVLIPASFYAFTAVPDFKDLDTSYIKHCQVAGEIVTRDILQRVQTAFPAAKVSFSRAICAPEEKARESTRPIINPFLTSSQVFNGHGMTEGSGFFLWPFWNTPISQIPFHDNIAPLGTVSEGTRLMIRSPETGKTLRRNELGELCVSSQSVIKRYLSPGFEDYFFSDATSEGGETIQWFRTGDLALITPPASSSSSPVPSSSASASSPSGPPGDLVYVVGRIKDRIKRAGVAIMPSALEDCIQDFLDRQACVLAYPHRELGEEPLAVLKDLGGKTEQEIMDRVVQVLGPDFALGKVVTLEQLGLEAFPLNATGKVVRLELLETAKGYFEGGR